MIKLTKTDHIEKTSGEKIFESILLSAVLGVLAIRCCYTESLQSSLTIFPEFSNIVSSLSLSFILLCAMATWLMLQFSRKRFVYRKTSLEIPLLIFLIAIALSTLFAANKREAINHATTLTITMLTIFFVAQILRSSAQLRIILIVIVSLGCMNAAQCLTQATDGMLNIDNGSLEHWQYEHRLYSKDIKGFFSTSNSVSSFIILALFCLLAIIKQQDINKSNLTIPILALAVLLVGIALANSKGATVAMLGSVLLLALLLKFNRFINKYKRHIICAVLLLTISIIVMICNYGISHGKLPGGNSMLVRWQYWVASIEIIKDFPLGVGGGSFANAYLQHKIPAALETVSDPHNWILSIASQYSIIGLIGFSLLLLALPLKIIFSKTTDKQENERLESSTNKYSNMGVFLCATIVIGRMILIDIPSTNNLAVNIYVFTTLVISPAAIFLLCFYILNKSVTDFAVTHETATILACGVGAVLLHNLIDFAIFEAGITSSLVIILGCLVSFIGKRKLITFEFSKRWAIPAIALCILWVGGYYLLTISMVTTSGNLLAQAFTRNNDIDRKLFLAVNADKYNPVLCEIAADMYLAKYKETKNIKDLETAEDYCNTSISRGWSNYKNFEKLSSVFLERYTSEIIPASQSDLDTAIALMEDAIKRYPNKSNLWVKLAEMFEIAENEGQANFCREQALKFENDFQEVFREMYPNTTSVVYRMGQNEYDALTEKQKRKPN